MRPSGPRDLPLLIRDPSDPDNLCIDTQPPRRDTTCCLLVLVSASKHCLRNQRT